MLSIIPITALLILGSGYRYNLVMNWKEEEKKGISHLVKNIEVVGIVIVGEVENAVACVRPDPLEPPIPIRYATWLHLILTILCRHLGCEWRKREEWKMNKSLLPGIRGEWGMITHKKGDIKENWFRLGWHGRRAETTVHIKFGAPHVPIINNSIF